METYYWKSNTGEEVDFIIKDGSKLKAVQVCYNPEALDTKKREIKALIKCLNEFRLEKGQVITFDYESEETIEDKEIKFIPIWKFLLDIK